MWERSIKQFLLTFSVGEHTESVENPLHEAAKRGKELISTTYVFLITKIKGASLSSCLLPYISVPACVLMSILSNTEKNLDVCM